MTADVGEGDSVHDEEYQLNGASQFVVGPYCRTPASPGQVSRYCADAYKSSIQQKSMSHNIVSADKVEHPHSQQVRLELRYEDPGGQDKLNRLL
jgi:hypothetical protein